MERRDQEFFREATLRICGNLDIRTAMVHFLHFLQDYAPVDRLFLERFDPGLKALRRVVHATLDHCDDEDAITHIDDDYIAEMRKQYGGDDLKPFFINDAISIEGAQELADRLGIDNYSVLSVPFSGGRIDLGAMVLISERGHFTDHHLHLIGGLGAPVHIAMSNALHYRELRDLKDRLADDNRFLRKELRKSIGESIVGAKFGLREVMSQVERVAPLDTPVVLRGETGVGKDVIAAAIHDLSARREGSFVAVNCGAIPEGLIDSELFGHEKGAFTGASTVKRGRFERANGGTIFLDEVAELTPAAQVKLLRVLQNREIERVGGTSTIPVDIRVIVATNQDVDAMILEGTFRQDLWFRMNVFPILVPPLRERTADIPELVLHFLETKAREMRLHEVPALAPGALDRLLVHSWPGNIRELANVVERALILSAGGEIDFPFLDAPGDSVPAAASALEAIPDNLDQAVARHISGILARTHGRVDGSGGAAELLGVNSSTLRARMRKLGIPYGRSAQ